MTRGTLIVEDVTVHLRDHAVDRYVERVKPALDRPAAIKDLEHVAELARLGERPDWTHQRFDAPSLGECFVCWLLIGDDIAMPLEPAVDGSFTAMTRITSSGISEAARERRAQARRAAAGRRDGPRDHKPERRGAWRDDVWKELAA